jgi:hypothetical protein
MLTALPAPGEREGFALFTRFLAFMHNHHCRRSLSTLTALVAFIGYAPVLAAQQYCLSGTLTKVAGANHAFRLGDPIAVTATIEPVEAGTQRSPGEAGCSIFGSPMRCKVTLQAQIGESTWIAQGGGFLLMIAGRNSTHLELGAATLLPTRPSGFPFKTSESLALIWDFFANLMAGGNLPATIPISNPTPWRMLSYLNDLNDVAISFTGHGCAAGASTDEGQPSYLHGHSALSRASSRHPAGKRGHGRATQIPDTVLAVTGTTARSASPGQSGSDLGGAGPGGRKAVSSR